MISAIVAMSDNYVIGLNNVMPWHIPSDLKRVKQITMGKPCIMGRKTFESVLSYLGNPLPGRTNIVISRQSYKHDGILSFDTLDDALNIARAIAEKDGQDEIIIFGGAQIYKESLPLLNRIHMTRISGEFEGDAFFPKLNEAEWEETERIDFPPENEQPAYSYLTLTRR